MMYLCGLFAVTFISVTKGAMQGDIEENDAFWKRYLQSEMSMFPTPTPQNEPFPSPTPTFSTSPFPSQSSFPSPSPSPETPNLSPSPFEPPNELPCGIPSELRAELLTDLAEGTSGPIDTGSPQDRALQWLIDEDQFTVCPDDPKALQRYILAVTYYSTNGDDWFECSAPSSFDSDEAITQANENCNVQTTPLPGGEENPSFIPVSEGSDAWLTPVYECEWAGINCRDTTNCVDRIEFEDNGLSGTFPGEIRDLPDLRFLILERGTTQGTIPTDFGEIEDLLFLDLDFNQLTGTIPTEIFDLTNLFQLDLNDNFLVGTISPLLGSLSNLVFLQLSANDFTGTLPEELGQLTSLLTGAIEDLPGVTGTVPQPLCDSLISKGSYIFIADCNPDGGPQPRIDCSCCTDCFPEIDEN